ncbi:MAG: hypothetical protein ACOCWQ_00255 [Nanoarchaeota archaeon]
MYLHRIALVSMFLGCAGMMGVIWSYQMPMQDRGAHAYGEKELIGLEGVIVQVRTHDRITHLGVEYQCHENVVVFHSDNRTGFTRGQEVAIVAGKEDYRGKVQWVAHRIRTG